MTTTLTKNDLAAKLAEAGQPLTASQIKNTTIANLTAMVDAIVVDVQMPGAETPKAKSKRATEHAPKREVKKVKAGSKRAELLTALVAGATADEIDALCRREDGTAWSKSAASAARGVFWRGLGYGSKVEGDKYFVTLPKGMKIEDCIVG